VSVAFQLSLPQIVAISKEDIIEKEQMNNLENWIDSPESLVTDLQSGGQVSLSQQLGVSIIEILEQFKITGELIPISANTGYNIDTLIGLMEREWGERDDFYE
ncbi:MAG: ATP/GTP-binding protein, partial [Candidatus Heimdallarchaeaceae archaeon]